MKKAFTLAEVLITLGIIGVVAAMTMPVLIQKNNNRIVETRLKKFYSVFNQAILMSVKDNGDYMNWNYWVAQSFDNDGNSINNSDKIRNSFEKYIAPYMKITGIKEIGGSLGKNYLYFLPDGGAFRIGQDENSYLTFFPAHAEKCIERSENGENVSGICSFSFSFYPTTKVGGYKLHYRKGLEPHIYDWNGKYEGLFSHSTRGCNENANRAFCTAVIQHNGWKIPKEYPFKISF